MLDMKLLRENPDVLRAALARRRSAIALDEIIALDASRRSLVYEMEQLRAEQNRASGEIAQAKRAKQDASAAIAAMKEVSDKVKALEEREREMDAALRAQWMLVPNIPADEVPDGDDESANRLERTWREPRSFDFEPKDHVDLGQSLGILDFDGGAKVSGARFTVLRGAGARLERALITYMLDLHTLKHGYTEILPPFLVLGSSMEGAGQLPKFEQEAFKVRDRDLWLVPTAEVPLTNLHRDEIIEADRLPIKYAAYTPSFRSEAGSYGKDTRGMLRQHQFDKVELYKFTTPEQSWDELESLTRDAEAVLQGLELPYRVVTLPSGDYGFCAAMTHDLEVWLPGQNCYREISSCSNCTDFQARRANIRFRRDKKPELVHTLNGSGLAVGRTLVAIIENYQQKDGSVVIPNALRPYMNGLDRIEP
ncbi:MAG: serine--tRNA ligase [Candidatus Hydrogenedentes bacterium]|nr:serine--tRNA ligase [Candidatus Hydrogenedentota bacterium]